VIPPQLSVTILSPDDGNVYHTGDSVTVTMIAQGNPAHGPFKMIATCAGKKSLPARVIQDADLAREYSFDFELTLPGQAWFNAYVEQEDGSYATDEVSYSVIE